MKLTCDLCGGELKMHSGGEKAVCTNCGLAYSMERLKEKFGMQPEKSGKPDTNRGSVDSGQGHMHNAGEKAVDPAPTRQLYIKRRVDFLLLSKVAVILDGQQIGFLAGQGKVSVFPISPGTHTISFRAADGSGIADMDVLTFHVGDHDWYGEFWLHRSAFRAEYRFEMREQV